LKRVCKEKKKKIRIRKLWKNNRRGDVSRNKMTSKTKKQKKKTHEEETKETERNKPCSTLNATPMKVSTCSM